MLSESISGAMRLGRRIQKMNHDVTGDDIKTTVSGNNAWSLFVDKTWFEEAMVFVY